MQWNNTARRMQTVINMSNSETSWEVYGDFFNPTLCPLYTKCKTIDMKKRVLEPQSLELPSALFSIAEQELEECTLFAGPRGGIFFRSMNLTRHAVRLRRYQRSHH